MFPFCRYGGSARAVGRRPVFMCNLTIAAPLTILNFEFILIGVPFEFWGVHRLDPRWQRTKLSRHFYPQTIHEKYHPLVPKFDIST